MSAAADPLPNAGAAKADGQYRRWIFTINNPAAEWTTDDGAPMLWRVLGDVFGPITGGVYQIERGEEGTQHAQGAFHQPAKHRLITMKNKMRSKSLRGWIDVSMDFPAAIKYCSKEDTREFGPFFYGDISKDKACTQGKRTDLQQVAAAAAEGQTRQAIAEQFPVSFIKYHTGITALLNTLPKQKPRDFKTQLHIFWGVAGTGKTRRMTHDAASVGSVYSLSLSKEAHVQWWTGYEGQDVVTIDDYNGEIPITEWFKMTDRYEYKVRVDQNAWCQFTSKHIYITCNAHPHLLYAKEFMKNANWKEAFDRRIDEIVEFTKDTAWQPPPATDEELAVEEDKGNAEEQEHMAVYHDTVCMSNRNCDCDAEYKRQFN